MALSGENDKYLNVIDTKMASDYELKKGRRTLIPGLFNGSSFEPYKKFAPGMISPLATSNAYIIVDEDCGFIEKDSDIKIIPTRFSFTSKKSINLVSSF